MIKQLPYGVQTDKTILHRAEAWCRDQWGPKWEVIDNRTGSWCVFWGVGATRNHYRQWWFATEEQRAWFVLRWS